MKNLVVLLLLSAPIYAQSADSTYFRAILLPSNEIPSINNASRGIADVVASAVRDSAGNIVSGAIDVLLRTTLPAANTATGLNLHNAPGSQTAPIALSTGLTVSNSRALQAGADFIHLAIPVVTPIEVAALTSLLNDPGRFYLNLTSSDQPNGLMRGQLLRPQIAVLLGPLDSGNVTPAIDNAANGIAQLVAIGTRDSAGNWNSGEIYLWTAHSSNDPTAVNGFHIHSGTPGTAGAVAITVTVPPASIPDIYGNLQFNAVYTEIAVANTTQTGTFTNLFVNPGSLYVDLHTTQNPNGIARAQLRPTDRATLPAALGSGPANLTVYTLRNEDGTVAAATMLCDFNLRLGAATQVLGIWLHDGAAGDDGPVSLKLTSDFSTSGFANYFAWTPPIQRLDTVQDLLNNPESHYLSLHTFDQPGGAARAQLGSKVPSASVTAALAANLDKSATTLVPGGLATIFGTALDKVPADLSGWTGTQLPVVLNNTRVYLAGRPAPLIYVSPNQVNLQIPVDTPTGVQTVTVDNGNGQSTAFSVNVAAAAPAIFFVPVPAVLKNSNFSLVTATNPARAGDVLLVYLTGLGQTTPALTTGRLVPATSLPNTRPVTATIGGRPATVVYSAASPGFTGLYQVAVTVPSGVTGQSPLQLQMGNATSNTVTIPVQ
jgi:uncharacterized protein (TIGR03437 family)